MAPAKLKSTFLDFYLNLLEMASFAKKCGYSQVPTMYMISYFSAGLHIHLPSISYGAAVMRPSRKVLLKREIRTPVARRIVAGIAYLLSNWLRLAKLRRD
jgi:hypothetical protein